MRLPDAVIDTRDAKVSVLMLYVYQHLAAPLFDMLKIVESLFNLYFIGIRRAYVTLQELQCMQQDKAFAVSIFSDVLAVLYFGNT